MHDSAYDQIGEQLSHFQSAVDMSGSSMDDFIERHYVKRWESDALYHVMAIRTSFVTGMQEALVRAGLLNMERVQMSLVTDPLNHDVEHTPTIDYKGQRYVTTHSMIYSKFLACHGPRIPGVWVDSPNIRLEVPSPDGGQRGRYLIDFSQLDVEVRRNRGIQLDDYFDRPDEVREILRADFERAMRFFEEMFRAGLSRVLERNEEDLAALGVSIDLPNDPFPVFQLDEGLAGTGERGSRRSSVRRRRARSSGSGGSCGRTTISSTRTSRGTAPAGRSPPSRAAMSTTSTSA